MSDTLGLACEHGMLARACEVCEMQTEIAALRAALDQERERSRQLGMRAMHADRCPVRGGPVLNATVTGMPIECMCGLSALLSGRGEGGG